MSGKIETRENPKGFSLGWEGDGEEVSSYKEMEMVERFLFSLQGKRVVTNLEDRILWKEAKDENFSVRTLYNVTEGSRTVLFPKSVIWSPCVPTKLKRSFLGGMAFLWERSEERLESSPIVSLLDDLEGKK
ncbi:hypothetical protein CK203_047171 [Vitis vinifera]|uniref:Reverse transcriptase zinc-binding domain-containing protein n=1 Tax=Vitis vinifera TaxID=29760 RepID=A0A438GSS3_VITVI|nr:hypothetical protein CK203_047171 [Vitis vinifera]